MFNVNGETQLIYGENQNIFNMVSSIESHGLGGCSYSGSDSSSGDDLSSEYSVTSEYDFIKDNWLPAERKNLKNNDDSELINCVNLSNKKILNKIKYSTNNIDVILDSPRQKEKILDRKLTKDKRVTVEKVLDRLSIKLLDKLRYWNAFTELYGCISSGKEANVYFGICKSGDVLNPISYYRAVKVFKTSILHFRKRTKYIEGDFRFQNTYNKVSNPRKMVKNWAEKEFRNLRRLSTNGIRGPIAIEIRGHIFAMTFLGDSQEKPPLLKHIALEKHLPQSFWYRLYIECMVTLRFIYQECKLVHGDFSEYNLIFCNGHLYVIDVSQSVEHDHPRAMDFLKKDCINVYNFFSKILNNNMTLEDSNRVVTNKLNNKMREKLSLNHLESKLNSYLNLETYICSTHLKDPVLFSLSDMLEFIVSKELKFKVSFVKNDTDTMFWPEFDSEFKLYNINNGCSEGIENSQRFFNESHSLQPFDLDVIRSIYKQFNMHCYSLSCYLDEEYVVSECQDNNINVFLHTPSPSSLQNICSAHVLEEEFRNRLKGEPLKYNKFLKGKNKEKKQIQTVLQMCQSQSTRVQEKKNCDSDGDESITNEDNTKELTRKERKKLFKLETRRRKRGEWSD